MVLTTLTAQLENRTTGNRTDIVTHGIGLLRGELGPGDLGTTELRVDDGTLQRRVQWRPVGRRYGPNATGSYKYIEVSYPTTVTSASPEPTVTISQGTAGTLTAWGLSAATTTGIATASIGFQVNGTTVTIPLSTIVAPGNLITANTNANDCKRRYRHRGRLATATGNNPLYGVGFEVTLDLYSGLDYCNWYVKFYYSVAQQPTNATNPILGNGNAWNDRFLLLTQPATFVITDATAYGVFEGYNYTAVTHVGSTHTFTVQDPASSGTVRAYWPFGFCYRRHGRMYFDTPPAGAANGLDTRGMAMDWADKSPAPYNLIWDYPEYIDDRADAIARLKVFRDDTEPITANEPLANGGLFNLSDSPRAGDAGLLAFGANKCTVMLRAGHPAILDVMEREAFKDWYRLGEFFDDNADPVDITEWPRVNIWHGRLFFVTNFSVDGMGVNYPPEISESGPNEIPTPAAGGHWLGLDREHWATVGQMHAALTGCNYLLLDQFETLHTNSVIATNYITGSDLAQYRPGLLPIGTSARDWGRGSASACCTVYEVSGRAEILGALRDRIAMLTEPLTNGYEYRDRRMYLGAPGVRGNPPMPAQNFPITKSGFGFWSVNPLYGEERMVPTAGTHDFNSQALSVDNDRPWVASTAVAGAWAAYLLLSDTDEATDFALRARYIAGDLAQYVTREGVIFTGRNDANGYRYIRLSWLDALPRYANATVGELPEYTEWDAYNHEVFVGAQLRGQTSWATGEVVTVTQNVVALSGGGDVRDYMVWLKNCSEAAFQVGETVELLGLGIYSSVASVLAEMHGTISVWFKPDASFLTQAEKEEGFLTDTFRWWIDYNPGHLHQYRGETFLPRNLLFLSSYAVYAMAPVMIARFLALQGFYASAAGNTNEIVLGQAQAIYDEMNRLENTSTTTTWGEFQDWAAVVPQPDQVGTAPGAPINVQATDITSTTFVLRWNGSSNNEDSFHTQYRETGEVPWIDGPETPRQTYQVPFTGLTAETSYDVQVLARNGSGDSAWSPVTPLVVVTTATPPTTPAVPTNPGTRNITTTTFEFFFTQVGTNVTSFGVQYRVAAGAWVDYTEPIALVGDGQEVRVPITGLTPNTDYEAKARQINGSAASAYCTPATAHTLTVVGPAPGTPGVPTLLNRSTTTLTVNTVPADLTATVFTFRHSPAGAGTWTNVDVIAPQTFVTITGLTEDTSYDVQVRATNGNGSSAFSASLTVSTEAELDVPTPPTDLEARDVHPRSAVVFWTITSVTQTSQILRFQIDGAVDWETVEGILPNINEYAFNNLEPETLYNVEVAGRNAAGDGAWSDTLTFETPAAVVINLVPIFGDILDDI